MTTTLLDLADVEELVSMICESVFGEPALSGAEPSSTEGWLGGRVELIGDVSGAFVVAADETFCRDLATVLFDLSPDAVTDADRSDALGELANMTGGNLKALLDGEQHLGLPSVAPWTPDPTAATRPCWFTAPAGRFAVLVEVA